MFLLTYAIRSLFTTYIFTNGYRDPRKTALENDHLFGGDMIIGQEALKKLLTGKSGVLDTEYRWPGYPGGARIPYVIDSSLKKLKKKIEQAMKQYHDNTCVRFVPRTNETEYVKIFYGNGCYAHVGKNESVHQPQLLSLGEGCHPVGTIVHELGHVIGLFHEQNRPDRDDYLHVHLENVDHNKWPNFKKLTNWEVLFLNKFDYESIMIYGNKAFSKNGRNTLNAKNGKKLTEPYEKKGLNKSDIERVNLLYKCK